MNNSEQTRLDRIEEKIDKMSEAVISLARAEEKIANLGDSTHMILKRLVDYDDRIRKMEAVSSECESKLKTISMLFWTTITATIASVIGAIKWINN
jgi:hypothetical protein